MNKDKLMADREADTPQVAQVQALKAIRESKGIVLQDIHLATRITVAKLEAIEEGRFHLLPEPVYTRTFIKSYARFIGIDDMPILERYENYLISLKSPPATVDNSNKKSASPGLRISIWTGAGLVIAVFLLYFFVNRDANVPHSLNIQPPPSKEQPTASPPKEAPAPQDYAKAPSATSATTVTPSAEGRDPGTIPSSPPEKGVGIPAAGQQTPAARTDKPLRLVITGIEKTWLRIREDQNTSQDMMIERGDVVERFASDSFFLDIGNAGGIELSLQGKPLGTPGKRGEVVHIRLP